MILWLYLNGIGCVGGVLFNAVLVIYVMCVFVSCLSAVLLLLEISSFSHTLDPVLLRPWISFGMLSGKGFGLLIKSIE
jgi:hypothetical protein